MAADSPRIADKNRFAGCKRAILFTSAPNNIVNLETDDPAANKIWHGSIVGVTVVLSPLEMPENKGGSATATLTNEPCPKYYESRSMTDE